TRVAAYRRYLRDRAADRQEEALLGAKMVGRWQSGAPLALAPDRDDPELGGDDSRSNAFLYGHDRRGLKCPAGAHARRANPRDAMVRRYARRRVLLRARRSWAALDLRTDHLGRSTETGGAVTASSTNTERWQALNFGPPPPEGEEPEHPVLLEYANDDSVALIT